MSCITGHDNTPWSCLRGLIGMISGYKWGKDPMGVGWGEQTRMGKVWENFRYTMHGSSGFDKEEI